MKKKKYEPHPKLGTKIVPSAKDYDRDANREIIEQEQEEFASQGVFGGDTGIDADFYYNEEGDRASTQEMYEHGFHIEIPEE